MRALLSAALVAFLLLVGTGVLAEKPKTSPAQTAASKKVSELDLCKLQLLQTVEDDASLKRQIVDLQKQLVDARAELQSTRLAEERRRVLQKAGITEGQRVDLNTGEIQAVSPDKK